MCVLCEVETGDCAGVGVVNRFWIQRQVDSGQRVLVDAGVSCNAVQFGLNGLPSACARGVVRIATKAFAGSVAASPEGGWLLFRYSKTPRLTPICAGFGCCATSVPQRTK